MHLRIAVFLPLAGVLLAGNSNPALDRVRGSVAVLMADRGTAPAIELGAAIVVREDGTLLTVDRVLHGVSNPRVRFLSGEVFDQVQLLGIDRRRGVAAIRIPSRRLKPVRMAGEARAGAPVALVSHKAGSNWTTTEGFVTSVHLSDGISGAGTGYRVIESTAAAPEGTDGGVMVDSQGDALGILVATTTATKVASFAIPLEDVIGLADAAPSTTVGQRGGPARDKSASATPDAPEKSEPLNASKSRDELLRSFKTMYVDAKGAKYFASDQLKAALGRNKGFAPLDIRMVDDPKVADAVLVVGYTFAWDFPFELRHQNTATIMVAGKGVGPFSGPVGAASVANEFVKALKPFRSAPRKSQ